MDNHPANHIPSPLWPLCIASRMGPSAFEPPPWAAGTRAYSVPAWRARGPAVNRPWWPLASLRRVSHWRGRVRAASWNIPGTEAHEWCPFTPLGSRISDRASSSKWIAPPANMWRCLRRSFCCGSGSAFRPRCSISKSGSGAGDAGRKGEPWFRSSGGGRAGEWVRSDAGPSTPASAMTRWRRRPTLTRQPRGAWTC